MSLVNLAHFCSHLQNVSRVSRPLTSVPMSKLHLQIAIGLYKQGFISSVQRGDLQSPDQEYTPTTYDNIATRRLWVGLKYHNLKPVLNQMHLVSHPNRRIYAEPKDIHNLIQGRPFRTVKPLKLGEVLFVRLKDGQIIEIQEAAKKHVGGELLCRAS